MDYSKEFSRILFLKTSIWYKMTYYSTAPLWCFVRFGTIRTIKKRERHPCRRATFIKGNKCNTPLWVFSRFLNCANGVKSCKASQSHLRLEEYNENNLLSLQNEIFIESFSYSLSDWHSEKDTRIIVYIYDRFAL